MAVAVISHPWDTDKSSLQPADTWQGEKPSKRLHSAKGQVNTSVLGLCGWVRLMQGSHSWCA